MANSATQNPANKVGRNSGAGATGVSRIAPTEAEARRGLEPLHAGERGGGGRLARLGTLSVLGAGVAAWVVRRARKPRSRLDRVRGWLRLGR